MLNADSTCFASVRLAFEAQDETFAPLSFLQDQIPLFEQTIISSSKYRAEFGVLDNKTYTTLITRLQPPFSHSFISKATVLKEVQ